MLVRQHSNLYIIKTVYFIWAIKHYILAMERKISFYKNRRVCLDVLPVWPPSSGWRCGTSVRGGGSPPVPHCAPLRPLCTYRTAGGWSTSPTSPEDKRDRYSEAGLDMFYLFSTININNIYNMIAIHLFKAELSCTAHWKYTSIDFN